jgi:8-oxoguanine deaminase
MQQKPRTLLVKNASVLVTMDETRREIANGGLFIEGNRITQVGATSDLPQQADEVLDLSGHLVIPGLVNTHHHMYQSLTRAVPAAQNAELFGWLTSLYKIWANLTPEMIEVSTLTAMANCCSQAARRRATISTFIRTARAWTTASRRRSRSACVFMRRAAA